MPRKVFTKTQNVVISADIYARLNLEFLVRKLDDISYDPETFPGAIFKIKKLNASFLLFDTGRVICTGTRSFKAAKEAITELTKRLRKLKISITKKPTMRVTNMVASGAVGGVLNLNRLVFKLDNTEYEPEQFPGLVYHMPKSHITYLLFSTGKIVITGARTEKEVKDALKILIKQLTKLKELKKEVPAKKAVKKKK